MSYTPEQMRAIFAPGTIAVVLAPESFEPGLVLLQALLDQGFTGEIFPISPNTGEVLGLRAYSSVNSVPVSIDLAIILAGIEGLQQVIEDCARKKVKSALVLTPGFDEDGEGAIEHEREIVAAARRANMRLVGPDCRGVYCPDSGLRLFPSMSSPPGSVGFITQGSSSGAFETLLGSLRGMGFSKVVNTGNESDLRSCDFIEYLGEDERTTIVAAHIEGTRNGRSFLDAVKKVSRKKPVIIWKTAPSGVWESALRQAGAIPARNAEEMIDIATAFYYIHEATGKRIAIISGPGGPAVAAADALERNGLRAATLTDETIAGLQKVVPPAGASLRNPVDLGVAPWGIVSIYSDTLKVVDKDKNVDATLLIGGGINPMGQEEYLTLMVELKKSLRKPCMLITWAGLMGDLDSVRKLQGAGYPLYTSPEGALTAYAKVVEYYGRRG